MPIRVTRRPYTDCPFRWTLSVAGVSGGEGKVSDQQCLDLNGDFDLEFKACASQGNLLIWESGCVVGGDGDYNCDCPDCAEVGPRFTEIDYSTLVTSKDADGVDIVAWNQTLPGNRWPYVDAWRTILKCQWSDGREKTFCSATHNASEFVEQFESGIIRKCSKCEGGCTECGAYKIKLNIGFASIADHNIGEINSTLVGDHEWAIVNGSLQKVSGCLWQNSLFASEFQYFPGMYIGVFSSDSILRFTYLWYTDPNDPGTGQSFTVQYGCGGCLAGYTPTSGGPDFVTWTRLTDTTSGVYGNWPETFVMNRFSEASGNTPLDPNDGIKAKWRLTYDIDDSYWTLRSFNMIGYPTYGLSDANPCIGNTKTLFRVSPPEEAGDGCNQSPEEVTITRACPPERSARQRKQDKRTGKRFRKCSSCDCQDEPEDARFTCQDKCESTSDEGCETYSEDQIECKFPKSSDCCDYCDEDKAPCAYEAMFECDIEHEGVSIAAKVVTLRHKCYFEEGAECDWVAVGPSPNPEDGPVGKQPVCASCEDSCLSGCSWSAWSAAECPGGPGNTPPCFTIPSIAAYTGCYAVSPIRDIETNEILLDDSMVLSKQSPSLNSVWSGSIVLESGYTRTYTLTLSGGADPLFGGDEFLYCATLEISEQGPGGFVSTRYCLAIRSFLLATTDEPPLPYEAMDGCRFTTNPFYEPPPTVYATISKVDCP